MSEKTEIPVWDLAVRIFHWSLVISFTVAYITAEEENILHIYAGYTVLALIIFRLIWGFIGSRHARFSDFIHSPKTVISYLKELINCQPKRYLGHNPLGGWMVIAMLTLLLLVTVSGIQVQQAEQSKEQTSQSIVAYADANDADEGEESAAEEFWEEIHETASNLMLLLIAFHVTGVILSSRLHKESLVKAMITGKKSQDE